MSMKKKTPAKQLKNRARHRKLYRQVRDGFHLMTIPGRECSNDW